MKNKVGDAMENSYKPKVLLVHNFYQVPGGEDTVFKNEKKLLEDHGHKVTIYDWKEYRRIKKTEIIEFHIGGDSELETIDAKIELKKLLNK